MFCRNVAMEVVHDMDYGNKKIRLMVATQLTLRRDYKIEMGIHNIGVLVRLRG